MGPVTSRCACSFLKAHDSWVMRISLAVFGMAGGGEGGPRPLAICADRTSFRLRSDQWVVSTRSGAYALGIGLATKPTRTAACEARAKHDGHCLRFRPNICCGAFAALTRGDHWLRSDEQNASSHHHRCNRPLPRPAACWQPCLYLRLAPLAASSHSASDCCSCASCAVWHCSTLRGWPTWCGSVHRL